MIGNSVPMSAMVQAKSIFELMEKDFKFSIKDRLVVVPEVQMYRIKEDIAIFDQANTGRYIFQVFFDGEFVCALGNDMSKERSRIDILKGLKRLYSADKIHWNKKFYEEKEAAIKAKAASDKAELEKKFAKAKTPEEKLVVAAVKRHLTKKKGKNIKSLVN